LEWNRWPDFQMIVDLAVEGDGRVAIIADHRLVSTCEVDDLQAHGAQSGLATLEDSLLVGTPMVQGFRDTSGNTGTDCPVQTCKSRNPAHYGTIPVPSGT
jgi:hypothetical protein